MSHYMAIRTNAQDTTIKLHRMRGDQYSSKPTLIIELEDGQTVEDALAVHDLEMVGNWIGCIDASTGVENTEIVDVFPRM